MKKILFLLSILIPAAVHGQGSMALAPARFELEMQPGTDRTVVVNVDYKGDVTSTRPMRLFASLNDWTMTRDGQVQFFPAGTRTDSATSWMLYSPGEASVAAGTTHQIRVTISVPPNAVAGDHLAALIIEQRPEDLRSSGNSRQMVVRYRMASVFYIKVGGVTRKGDLRDLLAESQPDGIVVRPLLFNEGNSVVRPTASLSVLNSDGELVADLPEIETLPVLASSESAQTVTIDKRLPSGRYTVKYRVDFQTGQQAIEGVTELVVRPDAIAKASPAIKKP